MKRLALLLTLLVPTFLVSQSCLPDGIIFNNQTEIDSFQVTYPNCTEIEGDVTIGFWNGSNITNLDGLSVLTSIGGKLELRNNDFLPDLMGLHNLVSVGGDLQIGGVNRGNDLLVELIGLNSLNSVGGIFSIYMNENLQSLEGLESLETIGEYLGIDLNPSLTSLKGIDNLNTTDLAIRIDHNDALVDLSGLESFTAVGGFYIGYNGGLKTLSGLDSIQTISNSLVLMGNEKLSSLTGLGSLTSIGGTLHIRSSDSLTDISDLTNLTYLGGDLIIYLNPTLSSLSGIDNINPESIDSLDIRFNYSLSECEVQSICDYLTSPGGKVEIYQNAPGCNNPPEVAESCGVTLACLPFGNYYFYKQSFIDDFKSDYPNCSVLEGDVLIEGSDISNLSGFDEVIAVGDDLYLNLEGDNVLLNLNGLDNLFSVGGDFIIGNYDEFNPHLMSLEALGNLTSVGNSFVIRRLSNLNNLSGLEGLVTVGEGLGIGGNENLNNIEALSGLNFIGVYLVIGYNESLTSLTGLDNVDLNSITNLDISYNNSLSHCEIISVCEYLKTPDANVNITNNAVGCDSQEQVDSACIYVSVHEIISNLEDALFPNPFSTSTTIEYTLSQPQTITFTFYNQFGKVVDRIVQKQSAGKQQVVWTPELPGGVYFFMLEAGKQRASGKLVIVN